MTNRGIEHEPEHGREDGKQDVLPNSSPVLFEERLLNSPRSYRVVMDDRDQLLLQRWKRGVDSIIEDTERKLNDGTDDPRESRRLKQALGENPSKQDIILYSIGTFILSIQRRDRNALLATGRGGAQFFRGGEYRLRDFTKGTYNNCLDSACVSQALTQSYGIAGSVVYNPARRWHYYWQEEQRDGSEPKILDTFYGERLNGLLANPEQQEHEAAIFTRAEQKSIRNNFRRMLPWNW